MSYITTQLRVRIRKAITPCPIIAQLRTEAISRQVNRQVGGHRVGPQESEALAALWQWAVRQIDEHLARWNESPDEKIEVIHYTAMASFSLVAVRIG